MLKIIIKYLSGESDEKDIEQLNKWTNQSSDNLKYFQQVRNIWEASDKQFDARSIDTASALKKVLSRIKDFNRRGKRMIFWYQRVAAILIIPLILGNIFWFTLISKSDTVSYEPVYNELYTPFGTRSSFKLPDGSLVWLNSESSLRYPDKFTGDKRIVYLKGEAYFEVESDQNHPFLVSTPFLNIEAVGTKFNVSGYDDVEKTEVTLVSGEVRINKTSYNGNIIPVISLDTSQHLMVDNYSLDTYVTSEDTYKYIAWKDGKLIFRNDPLDQVVKELSHIFNVDIEIKGETLLNYTYRATFNDESLGEILKLLKLSSPIDYHEIKRIPLPDGSFPKRKVIICPLKK